MKATTKQLEAPVEVTITMSSRQLELLTEVLGNMAIQSYVDAGIPKESAQVMEELYFALTAN